MLTARSLAKTTPAFRAAALAVAGGLLLGGCTSQGAFDRLQDANRVLTSRNAGLTTDLERAQRELDLLRQGGMDADSAASALRTDNDRLRNDLRTALASIGDLENQLETVSFAPLDEETDRLLENLAARYPGLLSYDSERGMLEFASDLTFDSGSAVVKPEAERSLQALAQVLTSDAATGYDINIVGHTDAERPSARTRERFPTNVHLSAARAISVRQALAGMGVPSQKMMVGGWGEYRPAVPNTESGNTPANRRVELFLVQPTGGRTPGAPAASDGRAPVMLDREGMTGRPVDPSK